MQDAQNTAISNEYRSVPISILVESATNPRKRFDEKNLEELAASMRAQGILAPLLVRELEESKYEVVAGARRLRAAKLAELETVPVRVVKLTDAESIEAQVVENLQREDIHPLEESLGFKSLLQLGEPIYTIASIAARAGKSEAYVQGRIKLADLIPSVAEAFLKDTIAIGHALLIAKLPDSQQQEAFNAAFRGMWTTDGNSQVLIPCANLRHGLSPISCYNWRLLRSTSRTRPLFPQQVRAAIAQSGQDSTSCFLPTCARTLVLTHNASGPRSTRMCRRRSKPNPNWCRFPPLGTPAKVLRWERTVTWSLKSRRPKPTAQVPRLPLSRSRARR